MLLLSNSFGQQRIGLDVNTTGYSMNFTLSYQKVFAKNFIVNTGLIGGLLSYSGQTNSPLEIDNGLVVQSPFANVNNPVVINDSVYNLMSYGAKGRGISLQAGVGYFHEFSFKHGIKFFLNGRIGYSRTETISHHHMISLPGHLEKIFKNSHYFTAISPEINHTIRLSGRFTFSYGFKLPYFFLIDQKRFNTSNVKDGFYGLEPEFKLGITYVIGKCDE
jgi:hypothetical protein